MSRSCSATCAAPLVTLCLALILALVPACQAPIHTIAVGPEQTYRDLNDNVLNAGVLSADARAVLVRFDLSQAWDDDPHEAIRKLHAEALELPARGILYALSELCYAAGESGQGKDDYLASAAYAYLYLFGTESEVDANPYDRRFRVACDLYNYGLLKALRSEDGEQVLFESGTHTLPVGRLEIHAKDPELNWFGESIDRLVPADNLRVIGLSSRRRDAGLGLPLIAVVPHESGNAGRTVKLPRRAGVPMTAILRLDGGLADLAGNSTATLELYSAFDVPTTRLGHHTVRLEADLSAPLAYQLGASMVWDFELGSLFSSDKWREGTGMWMQQPYQRGKIPVVFVHGTASSPARWAEMFNQLNADADLRSAYQFWFFTYTTGNPIPYSATLLRDAITNVIKELDPLGEDASLRDTVVIGHSQGGLLAKMMAVDPGETFWRLLEQSSFPLDKISDGDRRLLRSLAVFEPHPAVKRVVFIATPHHGSFVASSWIGRLVAKLVGTPAHIKEMFASVFASPDVMKQLGGEFPTSVDNMKPDDKFVQALASLDLAEGVHGHSIIAVDGSGPPDDLDDGAVSYKSAHLDHVDSEFVVRSGHSCQDNPHTIQEVRRILLEHLHQAARPAR